MKKHTEIENLIQKRLDRTITVEEEKVLNLHLHQCTDCHNLNRDMEAIQSSLFNLIDLFPGAAFNDRVMSKLGFKKSFAWARAAAVVGLSWVSAALFIILSPLPKALFGKALTTMPALVRFMGNVKLVLDAVSHFLTPLVKNGINPAYLVAGICFSAILFILFGTTLKKEEQCKASLP
jgi:hypothetical protein